MPAPHTNSRGSPRPQEESNWLPSLKVPRYRTRRVLPAVLPVTAAPGWHPPQPFSLSLPYDDRLTVRTC